MSPFFLKPLSSVSPVQQKALCAHRLNVRLLGISSSGNPIPQTGKCPRHCALLEQPIFPRRGASWPCMEGEQDSKDLEGAVLDDLVEEMEEEAPSCYFGGSSWTMDHVSLH